MPTPNEPKTPSEKSNQKAFAVFNDLLTPVTPNHLSKSKASSKLADKENINPFTGLRAEAKAPKISSPLCDITNSFSKDEIDCQGPFQSDYEVSEKKIKKLR